MHSAFETSCSSFCQSFQLPVEHTNFFHTARHHWTFIIKTPTTSKMFRLSKLSLPRSKQLLSSACVSSPSRLMPWQCCVYPSVVVRSHVCTTESDDKETDVNLNDKKTKSSTATLHLAHNHSTKNQKQKQKSTQMDKFVLEPIGYMETCWKQKQGTPRFVSLLLLHLLWCLCVVCLWWPFPFSSSCCVTNLTKTHSKFLHHNTQQQQTVHDHSQCAWQAPIDHVIDLWAEASIQVAPGLERHAPEGQHVSLCRGLGGI